MFQPSTDFFNLLFASDKVGEGKRQMPSGGRGRRRGWKWFGLRLRGALRELLVEGVGFGGGCGVEVFPQAQAQFLIDLLECGAVPAVGKGLHEGTRRAFPVRFRGKGKAKPSGGDSSLS